MKRSGILSGVVGFIIAALLQAGLAVPVVHADTENEPDLLISSFKVTSSNGQFVELHNNSSEPIDMSTVQLVYYNNFDVSKATSSKLISLNGVLPEDGYYLVNDSAMTLCYQTMVASASLNFSSTAGMVQVHRLMQLEPGGPITSSVIDSAAWSKAAAVGAQTLPSNSNAFLQRQWEEEVPKSSGGGSWLAVQPSLQDPCLLESILATEEAEPPSFNFLPGTLPPVRFVAAVNSSDIINRNEGKLAPVVNELLPNPASPQTDANDEFIELYNPNVSKFDLSGFKLAFGSTNPRKYTIPEGTVMEPKTFMAFTSGATSVSLSNSGAQVWLLDPNEEVVDKSEPYGKAADGQAWALSGGSWAWTSMPTLGELNAITAQPADKKSTAAVLGIETTATQSAAGSNGTISNPAEQQDAAPLHPSVLVGVGLLAVGYALYEYRQDMANRIFQFRRYLRNRRAAREAV